MTSSGDFYERNLLGHIEYRSSKPIKVYEKWSDVNDIHTIIKTVETFIRASGDLAEFRQTVRDKSDEIYLYSPLQRIFRTIEGAAAEVTGYKRSQFHQVVSMDERAGPNAENMSFPDKKPVFVLAEVPPASGPLTPVIDDEVKWRQICSFIEVRPDFKDSPNTTNTAVVKQIVSQGADYARLIMVSRPFQLYVLCVFIYGHKFCLGWYDRRGVILSDDYDIDDNLDILVNVVLQLNTHMTDYQLGHDRSACLLEGHSYYQVEYPSFLVSMGTDGETLLWKTMGPPIWSSLSLLGRGTATWRAISVGNKKEVVVLENYMEVANSEKRIQRVAELSLGDNVRIPVIKEMHTHVTVGTLRSLILSDDDVNISDDPILHRLVLKTVGRPLWDAETTKEFILGSLAALKGHRALVEQGILHQDISPGNIFLGDPNCAEVSSHPLSPSTSQLNTRGIFCKDTVPSSSEVPGAEIPGTTLFMAGELLDMMLLPDEFKTACPEHIERGVHHDLESFILVLFYVVVRRGLNRRLWDEDPVTGYWTKELYRTLFGGHTISEIHIGRSSFLGRQPLYLFGAVDAPMTALLYADILAQMNHRMQWGSTLDGPKLIIYAQLQDVYDVAISNLSAANEEHR
ncbi:hypothetical protein DFJ58DRAFT_749558 [Suillus subalutaceus]|uniref:uncharacterized protein n=1 Tax=Suillus subalutaceus TaxID=48586 RepID=UPI001B865F19|nr:uncharacterized protein DFJ58DRAFT_749558 [Suillus subalutaceus]KAG1837233.1 hypothetical protein DFJ58DRAFT_749558 [Suillus subalutaceus]